MEYIDVGNVGRHASQTFVCARLASSCTRWGLYPESILMRRPFIPLPGLAHETKLRSCKLCLASPLDWKGQVVAGYCYVFIWAMCILPGGLGILYFALIDSSSHEYNESCITIRGRSLNRRRTEVHSSLVLPSHVYLHVVTSSLGRQPGPWKLMRSLLVRLCS